MKEFRILLSVVAVLTFLAAPVFSAGQGESQEEQYVLRFNHVLTDKDPYHEAFLNWADAVEERTDGNLTIDVFHSAQLGVEEDIIEQIRQGADIGQNTDSARMGNYVPEIAVMNGPYFVDSLEEVERLKSLPTVQEWLDELEEDYGIKVLSFSWVQGFRNLLTNEPIESPDDARGLRVRSPNAPIWMESIRSLGATPVALDYGEVYTGIQQDVVDGAGNVYPATYSTRMYEVLDYLNETQHILLINLQIVSAEWFDSLPSEYQEILVEECDRAGLEVSRRIMGELAEDAKQQLQDEGMTIIPHEEIDIEAFKEASDAAYEALDLLDVRDQIFEELEK